MLLSDSQIASLAREQGMIEPFQASLIRRVGADFYGPREHEARPVLSYGCSSYGYDLRLSPKEFMIFRHIPGTVIDPKSFNPANLESVELHKDDNGEFFILPAHSYGLGVAVEKLQMPPNVTGLCLGKSTYARIGVIVNTTPAEACMADDTDILARTGWKKLKDVIIGEEVLTLNPRTMKSEYKPVLKKQARYHTGAMLHFHGKYIDQLVTPDHKMWVGKRLRRVSEDGLGWHSKKKGLRRAVSDNWEYSLMEASEVYNSWNYYLDRNIYWHLQEIEKTTKIGHHEFPTHFWLRFLGAWMGDGSAYPAKKGNYVVKLAVVTKEAKRNYFRWVLENLGVNYQESKWGFSFNSKDVVEYLLPYKGARNKHLPREVKELGADALKLVIEGMMWSDGNIETSTYGSVSERLADDFQEICLKAGYNCTKWSQTNDVFGNGKITAHKARFSKANSTPSKMCPDRNMDLVGYSGLVYDITVDNHIFYSRRNGRTSWTGNCWKGHLTLEFSNSCGADVRLYANEGVCQILFLQGEPCSVTYGDRAGKYQNQPESVTLPRI